MRRRIAVAVSLAASTFACGGGSSPLAPDAPEVVAAPAPFLWPASLDPAYVRALVYENDAHGLRRWAPGATMTHCFGGMRPDVQALAERAAAQMTALAGATRGSAAAACDFTRSEQPDAGFVFWLMNPAAGGSAGQEMLYADTYARQVGDTIVSATIRFRNANSVGFGATHESGHALGLGHSPREGDLMSPNRHPDNFTADELLVLNTMYR